MTGLDKIIKEIQSEADSACVLSIEEAKKEAENILNLAKKTGKEQCEIIAQKSAQEVKDCINRAKSTAELEQRKMILTAKQQIIEEVIQHAKQALSSLPQDDYFEVLKKMVAKFALPKNGEIIFSSSDLKRLPSQYEQSLNEAIKSKGAILTISNKTRNIDGGFVLLYGGIEENCSFTAMFDAAKERLQDKVNELLFS